MIFQNITINSGGQAGVDRAALDFALENNIKCGGWCPFGRLAEDGIIPQKYPLKETQTADYKERTRKNIEDSDGTIIIYERIMDKGTLFTLDVVRSMRKPNFTVQIDSDQTFVKEEFNSWLNQNEIRVLNVAGPRESSIPGIYKQTLVFFKELLK
jgi:hypothetical protein